MKTECKNVQTRVFLSPCNNILFPVFLWRDPISSLWGIPQLPQFFVTSVPTCLKHVAAKNFRISKSDEVKH